MASETKTCGGAGLWTVGCGGCADCWTPIEKEGETCSGGGGWAGCLGCADCTPVVVETVWPPKSPTIQDSYGLAATGAEITAEFGDNCCASCKAKYCLFPSHTQFISKYGTNYTYDMYEIVLEKALWTPCEVCRSTHTTYVSKLVKAFQEWAETFDDFSACTEDDDDDRYDHCSRGICSCCGDNRD